ncbi:MAG: hypothetical protein II881_10200, partial [Oscillospiraceae bacterium]|nr:hypothetical protein [Oscillospiraceae bacterium]
KTVKISVQTFPDVSPYGSKSGSAVFDNRLSASKSYKKWRFSLKIATFLVAGVGLEPHDLRVMRREKFAFLILFTTFSHFYSKKVSA